MARKPTTRKPAPKAAKTISPGGGGNLEKTISTRKISNGFVTRESTYNKTTGKFNEKETFSKSPPKVTIS